jgi:hypothetical protein
MKLYAKYLELSLADFQFPILAWEEFLFVEPCVHAVFPGTARQGRCGQAGVECAHAVTVRVGVAEEDFERAFGGKHFIHDGAIIRYYA